MKIQIVGGKVCLRHCQQTFEKKKFVDITQQCFAFTPQANFPAHNLNFHWRWRWCDQIQAIFLNLLYFTNVCKQHCSIHSSLIWEGKYFDPGANCDQDRLLGQSATPPLHGVISQIRHHKVQCSSGSKVTVLTRSDNDKTFVGYEHTSGQLI